MHSNWPEAHESGRASREPGRAPVSESDESYRLDLVRVLLANPGGLRRWSVMRAIRTRREKRGDDVSFKLEEKVERIFRHSCADDSYTDGRRSSQPKTQPLFYRPKERAGEVWAIDMSRGHAWLKHCEHGEAFPSA